VGADNGASAPPFDLRALAHDETHVPFRFIADDGNEFTLPEPGDLDIGIVSTLDGSQPVELFRFLLGDQWDAFAASGTPMRKLNPLLKAWGEHSGIDLGESSASPPSSKPTARRSRPTSRTTTSAGSRISRRGG
jgi:hypothetical protein